MFISSVAQQGLQELKDKLWKMLNADDRISSINRVRKSISQFGDAFLFVASFCNKKLKLASIETAF